MWLSAGKRAGAPGGWASAAQGSQSHVHCPPPPQEVPEEGAWASPLQPSPRHPCGAAQGRTTGLCTSGRTHRVTSHPPLQGPAELCPGHCQLHPSSLPGSQQLLTTASRDRVRQLSTRHGCHPKGDKPFCMLSRGLRPGSPLPSSPTSRTPNWPDPPPRTGLHRGAALPSPHLINTGPGSPLVPGDRRVQVEGLGAVTFRIATRTPSVAVLSPPEVFTSPCIYSGFI